jgi:hypothetical protein
MTRINCVPPAELHDKHLLAEYRELPRVFKLAYAAYKRGEEPTTHPQEYTMGKGHVKFFYTRLGYLAKRFDTIYLEMVSRGWKPNFARVPELLDIPASWHRDWVPTTKALCVNRLRIQERMHHHG